MSIENYGAELIGQRAVVTGAANGIGAACAHALAAQGVWTACADIVAPDMTVAKIESNSGRVLGITCDMSNEDDVVKMFSRVHQHIRRMDFLVHCAGIAHEKPLLETDVSEFDRVINVNPRGTFLVGREAIRAMSGHGRRVVLIASDLGYLGRETFSPYVSSKHGVMGLMRSWAVTAKEFAPNILVNAICPGPIDTDMLSEEQMTPEWREKEMDIPLGRFGQPEEIAEMAIFLTTNSSRFTTGQGMSVNGGSVMP
jgi:3-oxoacyl-[acyl-carrier protein] reductase